MENVKALIDGIQKDVYGLFYIYNSKYYFIYTEKELDENDYVVLYMTQIGRETQNTPAGPISTGNMIAMEITDPEEQKNVQTSISLIVEDKKNNTVNPAIQYLPMNMLTNLKIVSKKRFRLLKNIIVDNFKLPFETNVSNVVPQTEVQATTIPQPLQIVGTQNPPQAQEVNSTIQSTSNGVADNVIVDYRTKYFEEEEKNKELQSQIDILTEKLNEIKKVIE